MDMDQQVNDIDFLQEMADYNFVDKYAFTKENGEKETWEESVKRIYDMHKLHIASLDTICDYNDLCNALDECEKYEAKKIVLSSQRARQWAEPSIDKGILKINARGYNCSASYCDRPDFFGETIYLLLCGCGVGFNICKRHIDKLPPVKYSQLPAKTFVIPDTIEGWADAVKELINSYLITGRRVEFDYSQIRAKGSLISGRFKHSGFEPLKNALEKAELVIKNAEGRKLKSIECFDICCHLAEAVLSGGVRRSAMIALFSWDDEDMMNAKIGNWWQENPQRAMANISPLMVKRKVKKQDVERIVKSVKEFGEPGVVFADNELYVGNPCQEVGMIPQTTDGKSGWQFCNLTEINCSAINSDQEFYDACRVASVISTVQASYDKFPYLGKVTEQIVRGSALIGVSITGIMDSGIELTKEVLQNGSKVVKEANSITAMALGIMPAKRCNVVKPSGNASILLGTTSGIHPAHSRKYLRHIRLNKNSDMYSFIKQNCPELIVCDDKQYDAIIAFPITSKKAKTKADWKFEDFIDYVGFIYDNWIIEGDRKYENVTNNVSNTVTVKDDEWDRVADKLFSMKDKVCGISLLPEVGDKIYEFAPYCSVDDISDIEPSIVERTIKFIEENKGANIYDFSSLFDESIDMRRVYASYMFDKIEKEYNKVDWFKFKSDYKAEIGTMTASACSGGKCEII